MLRQTDRKIAAPKDADCPLTYLSQGCFIMLTANIRLLSRFAPATSPYGGIRLERQDDEPAFSTRSGLTALFVTIFHRGSFT